jgi:hypothetical protein
MGVLWVAVNDALRPLGATIADQPFTPERVLDAIAPAGGQKTDDNPSGGIHCDDGGDQRRESLDLAPNRIDDRRPPV